MNFFFLIVRPTRRSTLFPYTTLFRSGPLGLNHPVAGTTVVTSNAWHHVAATYDGTWKRYLDHTLDVTLADHQPPRADSIQHAALGTAMTSGGVAAGFFQGSIDEARIW